MYVLCILVRTVLFPNGTADLDYYYPTGEPGDRISGLDFAVLA